MTLLFNLAHLHTEGRDDGAGHVVDDATRKAELAQGALQARHGLIELLRAARGTSGIGIRAEHRERRKLIALHAVARTRDGLARYRDVDGILWSLRTTGLLAVPRIPLPR